mgnify:CR=1 FL=1
MERFVPFTGPHLAALAVTLIVAAGLSGWARRAPARRLVIRRSMALAVLAFGLGYVVVDGLAGRPWRAIAPLHLCDAAVFVAAYALWRRDQRAFELTFFWGLVGTSLAMLTPDLAESFPHFRFVFYFGQHGSLVVAALFLTFGVGMRPRRQGWLFAFLALNAYAAAVGIFDVITDANFLYLRHPPGAATALDRFGAWPRYILVSEGIAFGAFFLLGLVSRPVGSAADPPPSRSDADHPDPRR